MATTTITFRVYGCEHEGDAEAAIEAIAAVPGVSQVQVVDRDYEGEESIVVRLTMAEGMTRRDLREHLEATDAVCL